MGSSPLKFWGSLSEEQAKRVLYLGPAGCILVHAGDLLQQADNVCITKTVPSRTSFKGIADEGMAWLGVFQNVLFLV
jgi:hypothetical protein